MQIKYTTIKLNNKKQIDEIIFQNSINRQTRNEKQRNQIQNLKMLCNIFYILCGRWSYKSYKLPNQKIIIVYELLGFCDKFNNKKLFPVVYTLRNHYKKNLQIFS